jgi:hypothetical protein
MNTQNKIPYKKPQIYDGKQFESISVLHGYLCSKFDCFISYATLTMYINRFGNVEDAVEEIKKKKGLK